MNANKRGKLLNSFIEENEKRLHTITSKDDGGSTLSDDCALIRLQNMLWSDSSITKLQYQAAEQDLCSLLARSDKPQRYARFPYFVNADLEHLRQLIVQMEAERQPDGSLPDGSYSFDNTSADIGKLLTLMDSASSEMVWTQYYKLDQYSISFLSTATCTALSYDVLCAREPLPCFPKKDNIDIRAASVTPVTTEAGTHFIEDDVRTYPPEFTFVVTNLHDEPVYYDRKEKTWWTAKADKLGGDVYGRNDFYFLSGEDMTQLHWQPISFKKASVLLLTAEQT